MSDLVGNPEDRFSHNEAHMLWGDTVFCSALSLLSVNKAKLTVTFQVTCWYMGFKELLRMV